MTFAEHFAHMWWAYVVILIMICLSAYFSASEIAFNTANKMRLKKSAECGSYTAKLAHKICDRFTTSLSAILIGNNLANIAVSTCTTLIIMNLFKNNVAIASTIATILVTVVILIFGEIIPKVLSKQNADTDENYIYFTQWKGGNKGNVVMVYDWEGNYINQIRVKSYVEIESLFHAGDEWYVVFYDFVNKGPDFCKAELEFDSKKKYQSTLGK